MEYAIFFLGETGSRRKAIMNLYKIHATIRPALYQYLSPKGYEV